MKSILCLIALLAVCSASSTNRISINGRIVGGKATDISIHPFQVSLRKRSITAPNRDFRHSCGGSIYDKYTIITAAHCVISQIAGLLKIVAGTNYRSGTSGVISQVKEIIFHEDYNPNTYENDVAILILSSALPINNFTIKPIELATREYSAGTTSIITGWGTTESGGNPSFLLLEVDVALVDRTICRSDYMDDLNITDGMICAGYRGVGGKDSCQGDSGGPLVTDNKLIGIVSWGHGCADPLYPGVYANVPYYRSWILETISSAQSRLGLN